MDLYAKDIASLYSCHPYTITRRLASLGFYHDPSDREPWITPPMHIAYQKVFCPPPDGLPYPPCPHYIVYKDGRVWSVRHAKWQKQVLINARYYQRLCYNDENYTVSTADMVLTTFVGPRPEGFETNHLGQSTDNRLHMLEWCSKKDNYKHAMRTLRLLSGGQPKNGPKPSKYRGVFFSQGKWVASHRNKYLGRFSTEEEAFEAYKKSLNAWVVKLQQG